MTTIIVSNNETNPPTTISGGTALIVEAGGIASGTTVLSGGSIVVDAFGTASGTIVSSGGTASISGATVSSLIFNGANDTVFAGGVTTLTTLDGATETVSSGGVTLYTSVTAAAQHYVLSGGTTLGDAIYDPGAVEYVESGGLASASLIYYGGSVVVEAGGTSISGQYDGQEIVSSGGTDIATTVDGYGQQVSAGAVVRNTIVSAGLQSIASGAAVSGTTVVNSGQQAVLSGGFATATIVSGAAATLGVFLGGVESGAIFAGGQESVVLGGSAAAASFNSGALDDVFGKATAASVSGASLQLVEVGGAAAGTVIGSGGLQIVSSAAAAAATKVQAGGVQVVLGGAAVVGTQLAGGSVISTGVFFRSGTSGVSQGQVADGGSAVAAETQYVLAGGTASGFTVVGSGIPGSLGVQVVASGGTSIATVLSGGINLYPGGTEIGFGGVENVFAGGTTISTLIGGGCVQTVLSGVDSGAVIDGEDFITGGTALNDVVYGALNLSGGTALNTVLDGGSLQMTGGLANGVTNSGGAMQISAGGTVVSASLVSGSLALFEGALASGVTAGSGGYIQAGAVVETIFFGSITPYGGTVVSATLSRGASAETGLSGVISDVTVLSGATAIVNGGGEIDNSIVSAGGSELVSFGYYIFNEGAGGFSATSVATPGVTSNVTIDGGVVQLSSGSTITGQLQFGAGAGTLGLFSGAVLTDTISGFAAGDVIDLVSATYVSGASAVLNGSDQLSITDGATSATLNFNNSVAGHSFAVAKDAAGTGTAISFAVACFTPGTMIRTPGGERPVERLAIGDAVCTMTGVRPVKWIGRRSYEGPLAALADIAPIRIKAGAIGPGMPARDVLISPQHALLVEGMLVPARCLTNGASIARARGIASVSYLHLEFEGHEVIFADGMPVESFADCDSRGMFENASEFAALYPGAGGPSWRFCAPRLEGGPVVRRLRAALAARVPARPRLRGCLERADARMIAGWVQDEALPQARLEVEVRVDGHVIDRVTAQDYRADVRAAGIGDGYHGFCLARTDIGRQDPHRVSVRAVGPAGGAIFRQVRDVSPLPCA